MRSVPLLVATSLCAATLHADTTWVGPTSSWNTGTNWSSGVPTSTDVVFLNATAPYSIDLGMFQVSGAQSIHMSGSSAYTLTGSFYFLQLLDGLLNDGTESLTLTTSGQGFLSFADAATVTASSGGGSINFNGIGVTNTSGIDFDGTGEVRMNSVVSGDGGITQSGSGTTYLNMANTYTGGTTISGGILSVGNSGALGTGSLSLDAGTLQIDYNGAFATSINLNGGFLSVSSGSHTLTGNLGGSGDLVKNGAGSITLDSGEASYTGATIVNAGTLILGSEGSIPVGTSVTVNGGTFNTGANSQMVAAVTVGASGKMTLGGGALTVGTYSGETLNVGQVNLGNGGTLNGSGTLVARVLASNGTINATGNMTIGSATAAGPLNAFSGNLNVGSSTVTLKGNNANAISAAVQLAGGTLTGTQNFAFSGAISGYGNIGRLASLSSGSSISVSDGQTLTFSQGLNGNGRSLGSTGTVKVVGTYKVFNGSTMNTVQVGGLDLTGATVLIDLQNGATANIFNNSGAVDITGGTLTIVLGSSFSPVERSWNIFADESQVTGSFSVVNLPTAISSEVYFTYDYVNNVLTMVPEPSTYALFGGLGALGLVVLRRRSLRRA